MRCFRETGWNSILVSVITLGVALIVIACGTTNTRDLQTARVLYSQAKSNPAVVTNASASLDQAADTLRRAEKEDDPAKQRHLARIAETQIQQAVAEAQDKQAEKEAAQLQEQKNQILLQAKEREAAQARARTESATREMQTAQQQAQQSRRRAEQARRETMELRSQLEELQARETERGLVITLSDVYFRVNRADLEPGAAMNLARLADFLKRNPDRMVVIEGHTDSSGSPDYNLSLSQQRANSVAGWLIANGANPNQLSARGYGESLPVASNMTAEGRQQNRRVDIVVLSNIG